MTESQFQLLYTQWIKSWTYKNSVKTVFSPRDFQTLSSAWCMLWGPTWVNPHLRQESLSPAHLLPAWNPTPSPPAPLLRSRWVSLSCWAQTHRTWSLLQAPSHLQEHFSQPQTHKPFFFCFKAPKTALSACSQVWKTQNLVSISKYRKHRTDSLGLMTLGPEAQEHIFFWEGRSPKTYDFPSFSGESWSFAALKQLPCLSPCLENRI